MKKINKLLSIGIILLLLFANNNVLAQFDLNPTDVNLGDIYQDDYYEFTFTIFNWGPDGTEFTVTTPYPWPDWLNVEPMEFTIDFGQEQIIVCSGICDDEMSYYGDHAVSIEFEDDAPNFPNWNWAQVWWTSHPPTGPEDSFEWLNFDDSFFEQETLTYSIVFHDDYPPSPPANWIFKMILYSQEGEYIYFEDIGSGPMPQTWEFEAPILPQGMRFVRTDNGEILGRVYVEAIGQYGYVNDISRVFKIKKDPSKPLYHVQNSGSNEIDLHFQNYINGATSYVVYYDNDPNPPFDGTGLVQGNSPITTNDLTSLNLSGLQECTDYYFAVKAVNSYGESELSDVKKVIIFETPNSLPIYFHHGDITISENKSIISDNYWNYYLGNLIIEAGTEVTIEGGTIYFDENSKIIIEPGGKLILDGTTVTAPCGQTWAGIEVWGDPDLSQYEYDGVCYQGILELKGGATIENAITGVLLGFIDENGIDSKGGGMIIADYIDTPSGEPIAKFINNKWAIRFRPYYNFHPADPTHREFSNFSLIENCTFDVNQDYLMGAWWHSHIHLFGVNGIKIRGNSFINNKSTSPSGHGINAYSAGFKVYEICNSTMAPCPEQYMDKNTFTNFTKGINLIHPNSYTASVKNSEFHNNSTGIVLKGVNNASLLFNDFYLGEANDNDGMLCDGKSAAYGIDLTACMGFAVEENEFSKAEGAPFGNYIGIRVTNCPSVSDVVYKNSFDGVSVGNQAEGYNWTGEPTSGITYFCNENIGNSYDFYVAFDSKIAAYQGYNDDATGNTLSLGVVVQFQNDSPENPIIYFYNQNEPDEVLLCENVSEGVFPVPTSDVNNCPSHYGGINPKNVVLSPEQKMEAEQDYAANLTDYNNVKALFDNLKDGGSTEATLTDVTTAWPNDMWELRAKLLGDSPHLSMEVLKAASDKTDVLPESVLFEILSANPDELKKEELIKYLEDKQNPLPPYMVDILRQLANGTSYKTVLLSEMAAYNAKKVGAAQDIVRSILNEDSPDMTELRNWLDNIGGIEADKQIIGTYISEGNYASAQSLIDLLPGLYELSDEALLAYNDYKTFTGMTMNIEQDGRTIYSLSDTELATVVDIAENGYGNAKTSAQGLLEFAYGYDFCNCPDLPEGIELKSSNHIDLDKLAQAKGLDITVEPNPVSTWAALNYSLPLTEAEAVIKITDNSGKTVQQIQIDQQQGQYVLDTRSYKAGIYYYTILCGNLQRTGKLVVK